MMGLTFIRKLYDYSMEDVAKVLNTKRQVIWKYEHRLAPISSGHIEKLVKIFNLDKRLFYKELDEIDKIKIQVNKIQIEMAENSDYVDNELLLSINNILEQHTTIFRKKVV